MGKTHKNTVQRVDTKRGILNDLLRPGAKVRPYIGRYVLYLPEWLRIFCRKYWIGTVIILIATAIFFWPLIIRAGTYSEGGDAMFNSWAVARNQHCILRQGCPVYANGNVFYPHKDTMLYSESEFSSGLLTLPLYFVNQNPLFSNNVWTIASFFFSGWFMYLLAKRLSKGNELFSVLAGLIFEFAPIKMTEIWHLQNLSIFYLPLAILLILKFFEKQKRGYLVALFVALFLQFYASWYQMIFVLVAVFALVGVMALARLSTIRQTVTVLLVTILAALATLPLATQYIQFSKSNHATFTIGDQVMFSSSLSDYAKPYHGTILGKLYYTARPHTRVDSYNPDSVSYHGLVLYVVAITVLAVAYIRRRQSDAARYVYYLSISLVVLAITGGLMSLGPLLKVKGSYIYPGLGDGLPIMIPLPYVIVDKLLPQLAFLRAIGRASILVLFSLCCLLAIFPTVVKMSRRSVWYVICAVITVFVIVEILPDHQINMSINSYAYNLQIPKVYQYIKSNPKVDDLIVLAADKDYPNAPFPISTPEDMLWAGYTNRNIFNGYSSYQPPEYAQEYADFVDFHNDDVAKMRSLGLRYILVDKMLSSSNPLLAEEVSEALPKNEVYNDSRYSLFSLN